MAHLLQLLVEQDAIFVRQLQQRHQLIDNLVPVSGALTGQGQVEAGPVIGKHFAIAVEYQAALGRNRQYVHPVVFRNGRVVFELGDLQEIHPRNQTDRQQPDQHSTGNQALVDQSRLFLVVFQGIGLGISTASR